MIIWISLQCSESCGVGQKNRTVECVWKHTDESAGDACRSRKKPDAIKQCTMQPCTTMSPLPLSKGKLCQQKLQNSAVFHGYNFLIPLYFHIYAESFEDCSDSSKYCGLIVSFKMCHKDKYKSLCCSSCTKKAWNSLGMADLKSISNSKTISESQEGYYIFPGCEHTIQQTMNTTSIVTTYNYYLWLWNDVLDTNQHFFEQMNSSTSPQILGSVLKLLHIEKINWNWNFSLCCD